MRRLFYVTLILSAACFPHTSIAKDTSAVLPDELMLSGDNIINAQIEGQPVRLQVRSETYGLVTLNAEAGKRLGLNFDKVGMRLGYRIGPQMVDAPTKVLRINLGAKDEKNRIAWTIQHQATTVADGIISPDSLPYKRVTFNLRDTVNGTLKEHVMPLDNFGFFGLGGIGTTVKTGKAKVHAKFSLTKTDNLIDASTANWLANWRGGAFVEAPKEIEIAFGVKRPVRKLQISEPIIVGPFAVNTMLARISDYGDATAIKSEITDQAEADTAKGLDTDEIVVTGKKQKDENNTINVALGSDFLQRCTKLTYDFDKREIRMMCAV
jgi:hypothetical protein